jgi:ribose-phosphate pyrophosphokinase
MYGDIKLFAGSGCADLAHRIADYIGIPISPWDIIEFPNENILIRLHGSVRGQDVYVIQSHTRPVHRNIMEMLIAIDCLNRDSAGRITADRWMTIDLHAGQIQGFYKIPGDSLTAFHILADYFGKKDLDAVVVTPDLGYAKGGRNYAADLNLPLAFVEKRRIGEQGQAKRQALTLIGSVQDKDVIIVDDLVDTAGSIQEAVSLVKENGARDVYVGFTHPVLSDPAVERLQRLPIKEIVTTDTLPIPPQKMLPNMTILTVAEMLGEVILRTHEGRSVGELFDE